MSIRKSFASRQDLENYCANLARAIKEEALPPGIGFALLLFDYGESGDLAYAATAAREDMIKVLDEFKQKLIEGRQ